jgi:hypothetical protein
VGVGVEVVVGGGASSDSLVVFFACRSRIRFKSSSPKFEKKNFLFYCEIKTYFVVYFHWVVQDELYRHLDYTMDMLSFLYIVILLVLSIHPKEI